MDRRNFLKKAGMASFAGIALACTGKSVQGVKAAQDNPEKIPTVQDSPERVPFIEEPEIFKKIVRKAKDENWGSLEIGELTGKIGMMLVGIPYVGGTLETLFEEECTVTFHGLDCVTFFENSLGMARMIKKGKNTFADLVDEVTFTRYRNGVITDYSSRLHYTADWIYDNVQKGVVNDISKELGGKKFPYDVYFMTQKAKYYKALQRDKSLIPKIKECEKAINARDYYYIPQNKIKSIEKKIKTGDILAFATDKKGLDYAHTGLAYVDDKGIARVLHASSANGEVKLGKQISKYVKSIKSDIGISIARPLF